MRDRSISRAEFHQGSRFVSYGLGLIATSIGLTLLMQDHSRMSSPGWQVAFSVFTPTFWGVYIAGAGITILCTIPFRDKAQPVLGWACIAVAIAWLGRVVASLLALEQPHASGTAPQTMLIAAGAYFTHGALHLGWLQALSGRWNRLVGR